MRGEVQEKFANKGVLLEYRYNDVVAVQKNSAEMDSILLTLPWPDQPQPKYPDTIANLVLTLTADICVIDTQDQQGLVAVCVCAPSYWRLRDKFSQPLRWRRKGCVFDVPVTRMHLLNKIYLFNKIYQRSP